MQRSPSPGARDIPASEPAPARGEYVVELSREGSYVFVFNTFDVRRWSEPTFTALRTYMQQVFPGAGDETTRHALRDLGIGFTHVDAVPAAEDRAYEVRVQPTLHQKVIAWMRARKPGLAPRTPRLGGHGLRRAAGSGGGTEQRAARLPGMTATSTVAEARTSEGAASTDVDGMRALYDRLRTAFPEEPGLQGRAAWPAFLAFVADHADALRPLLARTGPNAPSLEALRKLLAQFQQHREIKSGDSSGQLDGRVDGKPAGEQVGTRDGDVRERRPGGSKDGSIYGEAGGSKYGWVRWEPRGQINVLPKLSTYVAGSSVEVELAWDLSVHPQAGLILLPNHCEVVWTVRRNGKRIASVGGSVFADDRRTSLSLGDEPGSYEIEVVATSNHFKSERRRFSSSLLLQVVSEKAFDRAAFDTAHVAGPDAAFLRDEHGRLHLRPGETAHTAQQEISSLDLTRGGIDALASQGKIAAGERDVAAGHLAKQRNALLEIQDRTNHGTAYVVRGTFVSREDSSTLPLRLLLHVVRSNEASGIAHYDVLLHDLTFGEAVQHPGRAWQRFAHDPPAALVRRLETEALADMAEHVHAHNEYPKGTVHLAAQRLTDDAVWETTIDTHNRRKKAKRAIGTVAALGGIAMLIVPGGSVVSAGLMVVTSTAGIASVALELEGRLARDGRLQLDRRLVMDVLQVVAISLPFGTLTRAFAAASLVGKGRFVLCMAGLDVAQGFLIAHDVKQQLGLIDANAAVQLAGATTDDQRAQIRAERDRRVAEVIGGAMINGSFLLISLGGGIKNAIAITRAGLRFKVREPVRDLATQGRERMQESLASDSFEHDGARVQLSKEERRYLERELATPQPSAATAAGGSEAGHAQAHPERQAEHEARPISERDQRGASSKDAGEASSALKPAELDEEVDARGIPEFPISIKDVSADIEERGSYFAVVFIGRTHSGEIRLGSGTVGVDELGIPQGAPAFELKARYRYKGREYAVKIYDDVAAVNDRDIPEGRGQRTSLTAYAIEKFNARYRAKFGHEPKEISGVLIDSNKLHYQREYAKLIAADVKPGVAKVEAAKRISFGIHRINAGYTEFEVVTGREELVDLGELGLQPVPSSVRVTVRRP